MWLCLGAVNYSPPVHLKGSQVVVIGILLITMTIHNKHFSTSISLLKYIYMCTFRNSFERILMKTTSFEVQTNSV